MTRERPIFDAFPNIEEHALPFVDLGDFPTPVHSLEPVTETLGVTDPAFVKRDDLSSDIYGGNKVRTLEVLFADALRKNATHIYSTGAFGTNHGAATLLHAPRVGLVPGLVVFPQPVSHAALANFELLSHSDAEMKSLLHWIQLPFGMATTRVSLRLRGKAPYVMVPGGATARGAMGYVSAALELAHQIDAGELPAPQTIVVGVGSTCTSAGLLLGTQIAARLGLGWSTPPTIVAVRVTPWPVTSAYMVSRLAEKASGFLHRISGKESTRFDRRELVSRLELDPHQLGRGYGHPTNAGREAIRLFRAVSEGRTLELDTTYSAKAAASLIARLRGGRQTTGAPWLFWSTKSTAPLPTVTGDARGGWVGQWWSRRARRTSA